MANNKMREALVKAQTALVICEWPDGTRMEGVAELLRQIDAALAAPPRNCDKYATADEALKAQEQMFNNSNFANGECKLGCPECDNPRVGCKIAWLFAPATDKEGGNNGK